MGSLKPGATYIYERHDGVIYAREAGALPESRIVVGYESPQDYARVTGVKDDKLWREIRRAAQTNPTLQDALDHALMIYTLSKEYKDGI